MMVATTHLSWRPLLSLLQQGIKLAALLCVLVKVIAVALPLNLTLIAIQLTVSLYLFFSFLTIRKAGYLCESCFLHLGNPQHHPKSHLPFPHVRLHPIVPSQCLPASWSPSHWLLLQYNCMCRLEVLPIVTSHPAPSLAQPHIPWPLMKWHHFLHQLSYRWKKSELFYTLHTRVYS